MKRPLQLSLAIALALGVTDAFALGLGAIQVRSGLNQPLVAEIPIIQGSPGEAEGLIVQLASDEDFERVGLSRSSLGVPVEFSLGKNARGEPVIKLTSREVVREPFLGFLVEANWPKGRLLREYTVLLDPPTMAPAVKGSSAIAVAAKDPERAPTQALPETRPAPAAAPAPASPRPATVRNEPKPASAPSAVSSSDYGPVAAGETLGEIARATRPAESVSVNQMMLALLKSNPNAFYKDNINALKRGAVLRIPSADEIAASGSTRDAAATVRAQIDEWRGGASSAPTLVADTAPATVREAPKSSTSSAATGGERLALVPPREGKAGQNAADRPSGGTAGGSGDVATKAELARVKEALTSREQESGELKSRVKDLEEIKGKNDKLISLQNTELAELRNKLKALQDEAAKSPKNSSAANAAPAPAQAAPATETAVMTTAPGAAGDAKITKDDIWGDGAAPANDRAAAAPASSTAATASQPVVETPAAANPAPDAAAPAAGADATVTSSLQAPASAATAEPAAQPDTAAKPAVAPKKEPKKAVPAPVTPPAAAAPWYLEPWVLGAAGVGGLLLVLLGVAGMRKRKPAPAASRASIASSFGDAPVGGDGGFVPHTSDDAEEQELIDQVRRDPGNAGSHLELLSLYYAQRATPKFEAAAEEMYAYIADPSQPEWTEARRMGEELVPNNPLFGNRGSIVDGYSDPASEQAYSFDEPSTPAPEFEDYRFDEPEAAVADHSLDTAELPVFDFDLGNTHSPAVPPIPAAPPESEGFTFDLPPLDSAVDAPIVTEYDIESEPEASAAISDDEFFAGEDAIGTKLDLAKAYLDMGDPEGARSMLEEVLSEGSPLQQAEARKLIAEIR